MSRTTTDCLGPCRAIFARILKLRQEGLPKRPNCRAGGVSRYELEAFMERKRVAPKKWLGGHRLGMRVESLDELLSRLKKVEITPNVMSPTLTSSTSRCPRTWCRVSRD